MKFLSTGSIIIVLQLFKILELRVFGKYNNCIHEWKLMAHGSWFMVVELQMMISDGS
jgi:hypothetical protein